GRTLAEWVAVAKTCPEAGHRARLKWFKETHGLLQNRASYVLGEAFPSTMPWSEPDGLRDALWSDSSSRAIFEAVRTLAEALPDVVAGQRKGYSAWSRKVQFAAIRPVKGGTAMLGLALPETADPRLAPCRNESWSERLKSRLPLASPAAADGSIQALLRQAWSAS
ncbi:MAG TPA: DUF5655 domain-containing protein, partial [Stellaceae bacterium]|nr:DUF5655 domain-containing protein [Stellaceae bacterium]